MGKPCLKDLNPSFENFCLPLAPAFFERETLIVARALLGCRLMRFNASIGEWMGFTIVETEAYTAEDPACHAFNKKTGRAESLYAHPGTAYVYLIYGMYDCLNVVTEPHGTAGAVLFRALEPPPVKGASAAPSPKDSVFRTHGPGRLTRALDITRQEFNGKPLTETDHGLYLAQGVVISDTHVVQTTRIGITKAADYPWRFYVRDNPWVSVRDKNA
jgi:DNA-3-methyladenine glycosylase